MPVCIIISKNLLISFLLSVSCTRTVSHKLIALRDCVPWATRNVPIIPRDKRDKNIYSIQTWDITPENWWNIRRVRTSLQIYNLSINVYWVIQLDPIFSTQHTLRSAYMYADHRLNLGTKCNSPILGTFQYNFEKDINCWADSLQSCKFLSYYRTRGCVT